ncbi:hypothetical protein LCGC14_2071030, partial [marine sediment metagenome]
INLYQPYEPDDDSLGWVCSVRELVPYKHTSHNVFHEFGVGDTWREAILVALHNAHYSRNMSFMWAKQNLIRGRNHTENIVHNKTCNLDQYIQMADAQGYLINSLQIINDTLWSCTIARKDLRYSWFWLGQGKTSARAVRNALKFKNRYTRGINGTPTIPS